MKIVYWIVGILLGIAALLVVAMFAASELGGEVVTLERAEATGEVSQVRIWIVDDNGASWIEHGAANDFWITRLTESPSLVLTREGRATTYVAMPDLDSHDLYHKLRREKYGWADQVIELFAGDSAACPGLPVQLQLAN